jgi:hypothetical protein
LELLQALAAEQVLDGVEDGLACGLTATRSCGRSAFM